MSEIFGAKKRRKSSFHLSESTARRNWSRNLKRFSPPTNHRPALAVFACRHERFPAPTISTLPLTPTYLAYMGLRPSRFINLRLLGFLSHSKIIQKHLDKRNSTLVLFFYERCTDSHSDYPRPSPRGGVPSEPQRPSQLDERDRGGRNTGRNQRRYYCAGYAGSRYQAPDARSEDCIFGVITLEAVNRTDSSLLLADFREQLKARATEVAANNPNDRADLPDWLRRIDS